MSVPDSFDSLADNNASKITRRVDQVKLRHVSQSHFIYVDQKGSWVKAGREPF